MGPQYVGKKIMSNAFSRMEINEYMISISINFVAEDTVDIITGPWEISI